MNALIVGVRVFSIASMALSGAWAAVQLLAKLRERQSVRNEWVGMTEEEWDAQCERARQELELAEIADDDCKYCGGTGEPCHLQRGDGRCYPDYDKNDVDWDEFDDMTVKWKEKKKEKELIHELEQKERVLAEIADDDSVVEFKNLSYYLTDCMQPFGQLQYLSPEGIPIKEDLNILWIKEGYVEVQEMSWLKERVNYLSPLQPYSPYTRWWEVSELYEEWLYSKGCDQIIMIDFEKEYSQDVWYGIMRTYQSTTYTGGDGDDYED